MRVTGACRQKYAPLSQRQVQAIVNNGSFLNLLVNVFQVYQSYFISFAVSLMHSFLSEGKSVLVEGANASMLDIDFGTYP